MAKAPRPASKRAAPPVEQPIAIEERGEHELPLEGVVYRLRPSHLAIRAIEKKTERSLMKLVNLGNAGDLTLEQMGIIAAELIRAGAEDEMTRNVGADRLSELIMEDGIPAAMARFTVCLYDAATGGCDASGNVKATTA